METHNGQLLRDLKAVCRQLAAARGRVEELERRRDALIRDAREAGLSGADLARQTGLSPGRVTQIVAPDGHGPLGHE